jgi:hypothetical protein
MLTKTSLVLPCPPRFGTARNPSRETLGHLATKVAKSLNYELMEFQQHVFDVALEIDPDTGGLWYREVDYTAPRQNGKTLMGMVAKTLRCTMFGGNQHVLYAAQDGNNGRRMFIEEHVGILERSAYKPHLKIRKSNGSEGVKFSNGSDWSIVAPTREAGHSRTLDHVDIDEAFAHENDEYEAGVRPTMLTRPSAQIWVYSTAGDEKSTYWWQKILAGRKHYKNPLSHTCFFEWSADEDAPYDSPDTWRACMPALGRTVSIAAIQAEWESAEAKGLEGINAFRRAYLNQWPVTPKLSTDLAWSVLDKEKWKLSALPDAIPAAPAWCLEVSSSRNHAVIGLGGRLGAQSYVEIADIRTGHGVDWVVPRLQELVERHGGTVVVDRLAAAGSFITEIEKFATVVVPSPRDIVNAASMLYDAHVEGSLKHSGQDELTRAASYIQKRDVGKEGEDWTWSRADGGMTIMAVTLARWAAMTMELESVYEGRGMLWLD